MGRCTFVPLFSRTVLFVRAALFTRLPFVRLPFSTRVALSLRVLFVRSFVTPLRVALLRVLLGRLYTRCTLLSALRTVRPLCAAAFLLLRATDPERTPASALDGPDARGT